MNSTTVFRIRAAKTSASDSANNSYRVPRDTSSKIAIEVYANCGIRLSTTILLLGKKED